jgi:hypothetical protein
LAPCFFALGSPPEMSSDPGRFGLKMTSIPDFFWILIHDP